MEDQGISILSVRENPEIAREAIDYIASKWAGDAGKMLYEDCITHCLRAKSPLPDWFLARRGDQILGCAGVIPNDFISRADFMPWLCALYVEKDARGKGLGGRLIKRVSAYARAHGFENVYIATDHIGYYEKYGARFIGTGYHPWNDTSRIYELPSDLSKEP